MPNKYLDYNGLTAYHGKIKDYIQSHNFTQGYLDNDDFYNESTTPHTTAITGVEGDIYLDLTTNKIYRFAGSSATPKYVEISPSSSSVNTQYSLSGAAVNDTWVTSLTSNDSTPVVTTSTVPVMGGTDGSTNGTAGLVPHPTSADSGNFLRGDGNWATPNNTTYSIAGAYGTGNTTWVTTLTPSSGSATTSTVPTASTTVYGITTLTDSTSSTSTTTAATPNSVKSAYDLADSKSTVSVDNTITTGTNTKVADITIDDTTTAINVPNMTAPTTGEGAVAGTAGLVPAPAVGDNNKFLNGNGQWAIPTNTTYTAGTGISIDTNDNNKISNTGVTSITTGSTNGSIAVSVGGATATDVSVYGLGTAAYTNSTAYATSTQGEKADTAIQSFTYNGTLYSGNSISIPVDNSIAGGTSSTNAVQAQAIANFVNSSVSTNTAYFKGTYHNVNELPTTDVTNNDYAFVINLLVAELLTSEPSDWSTNYTNYYTKSGDTYTPIPKGTSAPTWQADTYYYASDSVFNRYKYNASLSTPTWEFEYSLNNSSFTSAEWATIQSGLTATDKTAYDNHMANTSNPHSVTKAQIGLGNVTNDKQVVGLSSGTTSGDIVTWGADGYTVADSGVSIETSLSASSNNKIPTSKAVADYISSAGSAKYNYIASAAGDASNNAKTATLEGFTLATGVIINVAFANSNTASAPTLTITYGSGSGEVTSAIPLKESDGSIAATNLIAGIVYSFIFDGTNFKDVGNPVAISNSQIDSLFT